MNLPDPFEMLADEHYASLFRFAVSLTRSEADAGDLTQQTFYVWATRGHQLRDLSKAKAWLFTTLHRLFLLSRRRQNKFAHHELEEVSGELPFVIPQFANDADSSLVLLALARVDPLYQAAVALFYLEDWSYKEIATILDVPIGTVKSRIARGIGQLRQILESPDASSVPNAPCARDSREASGCQELQRKVFERATRPIALGLRHVDWVLSATPLAEPIGSL